MLLRVSSNQQLEADGDLSVQRQLVLEYIEKRSDWKLDEKEYFEGSNSGYKNSVADRDVLQDALQDARNKEYDILVAYKDDRIGRRMWEIGAYVMSLKNCGVDIYTVKDGCISPESDDIMGQMVLALRYGNAQKSSSDTGMRVKDTAKKLVQRGKFMGGKAPYGYTLELSGEISKHGRALKHLVIDEKKAEVVTYIYNLAVQKEYGSVKIAKILNSHDQYKNEAPNDVWKAGTIASILTNPIYAGYTAYNRRTRIDGKYHKIGSDDWIIAEESNPEIAIITTDIWNRAQDMRKKRADEIAKKEEHKPYNINVIKNNTGTLALIDVLYCGYCGRKMTNGSRYNYWKIKSTGERRSGKVGLYKCQDMWSGTVHPGRGFCRADRIEPIVFSAISEYIGKLQENENVFQEIEVNKRAEKRSLNSELDKDRQELVKIQKKIDVMEENIPQAMTGEYPLSLEDLVRLIDKQKDMYRKQQEIIKQKERKMENMDVSITEWDYLKKQIPTWQQVFLEADAHTKRVLVDKLIERIDIKEEQITIRFRIRLEDFIDHPGKNGDTTLDNAADKAIVLKTTVK
ncbi:recombinase family protein [Blautia sp.]|uniref:recombinase family protein n=1 Tax=Blautia sp. TaxID=1955243 RepID=UPI003AF54A8D